MADEKDKAPVVTTTTVPESKIHTNGNKSKTQKG
jgi:hypothetical protein